MLESGTGKCIYTMTQRTASSDGLFILDGLEDFYHHALEMANTARRELIILSEQLDFHLFNTPPFQQAVLELAKSNRRSDIKILVRQTQPIVDRGHRLLDLFRRIPSRISLKALSSTPEDKHKDYMIIDQSLVLFKNDAHEYIGFANYQARAEAQQLLNEFMYLWEQRSNDVPEFRQLFL